MWTCSSDTHSISRDHTMASRTPLKPDGSEIRLLGLHPGHSTDEIRCTLRTVTFDQNPKFEALSYVWGDPKDTREIIVDDQPFQATVNLEAALRALRKSKKTRVLWVDAICINQQDIDEKNVQVGRMHLIYPRAYRVLAWLGPSDPNVEVAESLVRTYVLRSFTFKSWYWLNLNIRALFSIRAKFEKCLAVVQGLTGFVHFLGNPYWARMWTFQEYQLASRQLLCLFGDQAVQHIIWNENLSEFFGDRSVKAWEKTQQLVRSPQGGRYIERNPELLEAIAAGLQNVWSVINCENIYAGAYVHMHTSPRSLHPEKRFLVLMVRTRRNRCSNPSDRIFALYGLCPALADIYPADYTKPYWQITLETTAYIVNNEPTGESILNLFGPRDGHLTDDSIPSWVPDFDPECDSPEIEKNRYAGPIDHFHGLSRTKVTADLRTLRLWGKRWERCNVTCRFSFEDDACAAQIRQIRMEPSYLLCRDLNNTSLRMSENLQARLSYACAPEGLYDREKVFNHITTVLNDWAHSRLTLTEWKKDKSLRDLDTILAYLKGKTLIVTQNGFFGIASQHVQDGDIVVLCLKILSLIILTTHEEGAGKQPNIYKLVGTAYIDGLCVGDFEDTAAASEIWKQRDLEEFMVR
ncbi:heterokaryon incompatibility protein-domain-containing protein [Xylaria bambusicola]|uniref:heterokaryon incompatibility protein-domain-containing protein n=1 Tax=Xylaria bambusicola TaxID=326684 RepID=UPI0020072EE1|nr:heterokaryon incompatibility protein-domain-containing protein [Xylaria bambusicola]KAI0517979.1 heterokaryon incompatibility protein-domain-containing protein [Xylaria bambusicola]